MLWWIRACAGGLLGLIIFNLDSCDHEPVVIWSATVASPDGDWSAEATTLQTAGPGINDVVTIAALRGGPDPSGPPIQVLALNYDSAYPLGITAVGMRWIDRRHLDISYTAVATPQFEVNKVSGLDISFHRADHDRRRQSE